MLVSYGNIIRPSLLGVTVFSILLIPKVILGAELESTRLSTRSSAERTTTSPPRTSGKEEPAVQDDPPPTGASFAEACYAYVHNFTYSAIVLYNMNQSQAAKWHVGRDPQSFYKLAANLTRTIMKLVEEMDQIGAMFSVRKEMPMEMYNAAENKCAPIAKVGDEAPAEDSSSAVPLLVLVILSLILYIGFLTYQIKTKYRNSGSGILIEDR